MSISGLGKEGKGMAPKVYLISNSTALPVQGDLESLKMIVMGNDTCVTQALYSILKIKLGPRDLVIFNEGINDCIYRKDKSKQSWMINYIEQAALAAGDKGTVKLMREKKAYVLRKPDEELFQFLTFEEFEKYLDLCFNLIRGQGIVLPVQKFPKSAKEIGWAYDEVLQTNEILKRKALEYNLDYLDLWSIDLEHYDNIHLTAKGVVDFSKVLHKAVFFKARELEAKTQ